MSAWASRCPVCGCRIHNGHHYGAFEACRRIAALKALLSRWLVREDDPASEDPKLFNETRAAVKEARRDPRR